MTVSNATVRDHAVWWLWPTTCLMRYPGRGNFLILNIIPLGPDRTLETYDFFLEEPDAQRRRARGRSAISTRCCSPRTSGWSKACKRAWRRRPFARGVSSSIPAARASRNMRCITFHGLVLDAYADLYEQEGAA
jgi:hypothetical protein